MYRSWVVRQGLKYPHRSNFHLRFFLSVKLICGSSWATLASSCPDLKVKISVNQVVNNDRLARMLLPEIPLSEYCMSAFYSPNEDWTPKPLLSDILPQYRHTLQVRVLSRQHYRVQSVDMIC